MSTKTSSLHTLDKSTHLDIPDSYTFMCVFWPDMAAQLQPFQIEELLRFSGYTNPRDANSWHDYTQYAPYIANMCFCNGGGKDSIMIAVNVAWKLCCSRDAYAVLTSSSETQLKSQTAAKLGEMLRRVNATLGVEYAIINTLSIEIPAANSSALLFVTNTPGRAEGHHPKVPGAPFMMVLNEIKSIDPALVEAVTRCSGFTHWLEISSPGEAQGYFHKHCVEALTSGSAYPASLTPGTRYFRRISYFDCPFIPPLQEQRMREMHGINSAVYRSSILALFTSADADYVIPAERFNGYINPAGDDLQWKRRAGVDLGIVRDPTSVCIMEGNRTVEVFDVRANDEIELTTRLVTLLPSKGVAPERCNIDAGGIGAIILGRMHQAGYYAIGHKFDDSSHDKRYRRKGAAMWWNVRGLYEDRRLHMPTDPEMLDELTHRKYFVQNDVICLQDKKIMITEFGRSPNKADAHVLACWGAGTERQKIKSENQSLEEFIYGYREQLAIARHEQSRRTAVGARGPCRAIEWVVRS